MKTITYMRIKGNGSSIKSIKFAEILAVKTKSKLPSTSQMMNYCDQKSLSEAIESMKNGEQIELKEQE